VTIHPLPDDETPHPARVAQRETSAWLKKAMKDEDAREAILLTMSSRGYGSMDDFVEKEPSVADALRLGLSELFDQDDEINDAVNARVEAGLKRAAEQDRRLRAADASQ
jgi:hypothetical protein